jgi:general secretion pathway protein G
MKKAFTMIELIFVIVILGILASVAVSKMAVTRDDAIIVKGKSQVAAIRNAITLMRNKNMLQGLGASWPSKLDRLAGATSTDGAAIFGYDTSTSDDKKLLDYPLYAKNADGHWRKTANNTYAFKVMDTDVSFTYTASNGQFDCSHTGQYCKALTE